MLCTDELQMQNMPKTPHDGPLTGVHWPIPGAEPLGAINRMP